MSSLPRDIVIDILTRLPVKSIARFKCVCRSWLYLFGDKQFCKKHYDRINTRKKGNPIKIIVGKGNVLYSIDAYSNSVLSEAVQIVDYPFYDEKYRETDDLSLGVLGSCKGIVCIRPRLDRICFWNPSTREHKIVLEIKLVDLLDSWSTYGFGYDLKTQDYKLVRFRGFTDRHGSEITVYSLASNSWSTTPLHMPYTLSPTARPAPVYFNGALYSLTHDWKVLVAFDLGDQTFREVPGPTRDNFLDDNRYLKYVDVLGGLLCVVCILLLPRVRGDVWVMKEYGVRESWTRVFRVPQRRAMKFDYFRPIGYIQNRGEQEVLLSVRLKETDSNILVCYSTKRRRARTLQIHGSDPKWLFASTYDESLFSVLRRQNSDGILHYLEDDQGEQEEGLPEHDHKRRKVAD